MDRIQKYLSPLRYPGSKRWLAPYIEQSLSINSIIPNVFIEPFIGGASVTLQLLENEKIERAIFIDIDPWIISFWQTIFSNPEWLIKKIQTTEINIETWNQIRVKNPKTIEDMAWTCFFLNRTNFSGILEKKVGPLGGKKQLSKYKVDCRFNKEQLIERIIYLTKFKQKIIGIWCMSWDDGIKKVYDLQKKGEISSNIFFYFDPPFFEKANQIYRYYFKNGDHVKLRDVILKISDKWLLSYDSSENFKFLYNDIIKSTKNHVHLYNIKQFYSLSIMEKRKIGKEIILSNLDVLPII